jgi:hypothetical protein
LNGKVPNFSSMGHRVLCAIDWLLWPQRGEERSSAACFPSLFSPVGGELRQPHPGPFCHESRSPFCHPDRSRGMARVCGTQEETPRRVNALGCARISVAPRVRNAIPPPSGGLGASAHRDDGHGSTFRKCGGCRGPMSICREKTKFKARQPPPYPPPGSRGGIQASPRPWTSRILMPARFDRRPMEALAD